MPAGFLEHANISVSDPQRLSTLLQQLCGWHERWRGPARDNGWTIHVGGERDYLALYSAGPVGQPFAKGQSYVKGMPLNHVGLVVDNLIEAERLVVDAGLVPFGHADYEPGRRFYFFDWDGIEFELVSYD